MMQNTTDAATSAPVTKQVQRLALHAAFGAGLSSALAPPVLHAAPPEYLSAERPNTLPLHEEVDPVDAIGRLPRVFNVEEAILLPVLRESVAILSPRSYFLYRDLGNGRQFETFAIGGSAGMVTGWIHDSVRFGVTGYTSQRIHGPKDRDGAGLLQPGQEEYSALGELYAEGRRGPWSLKVGRQELDLPYINMHDIRMTPNTFEAATLHYTGEHWKAGVAHTWRMKFRNSSDFVSMSQQAGADRDRGVTSLGALYEGDNASIGAINHYGWDTFNTLYTEASWQQALNDCLDAKFSLQFTDQRSVGDELLGSFDAQHFGAKVSLGYESLTASATFTSYSSGDRLINPWGGTPTYNSIIVGDFKQADEQAFGLGLSYDFSDLGLEGLSAFGTVVFGDTPDSGPDASEDRSEYNLTVDYRIPKGPFEKLWIRLRAAHVDGDDRDRWDWRFITNYTISF